MSTARRPALTPHQVRRAALRRRVEEIKAKRDARDAELAEQARREDAGKPTYTLEDLRRELDARK
ncbi:MAG: hypothetical protein ACM3JH_10840 [Acidithiobacillales bacterium]